MKHEAVQCNVNDRRPFVDSFYWASLKEKRPHAIHTLRMNLFADFVNQLREIIPSAQRIAPDTIDFSGLIYRSSFYVFCNASEASISSCQDHIKSWENMTFWGANGLYAKHKIMYSYQIEIIVKPSLIKSANDQKFRTNEFGLCLSSHLYWINLLKTQGRIWTSSSELFLGLG